MSPYINIETKDVIAEEMKIEKDEKENKNWQALGGIRKVYNIVK